MERRLCSILRAEVGLIIYLFPLIERVLHCAVKWKSTPANQEFVALFFSSYLLPPFLNLSHSQNQGLMGRAVKRKSELAPGKCFLFSLFTILLQPPFCFIPRRCYFQFTVHPNMCIHNKLTVLPLVNVMFWGVAQSENHLFSRFYFSPRNSAPQFNRSVQSISGHRVPCWWSHTKKVSTALIAART